MHKKLTPQEISKLLYAGQSPRHRRIETYEKYYDGTIYDGRVGFLDQSSDKPMLERAPCVAYPIVRSAVQSNVSLCLGESRFPQIRALTNEDDSAFDARFGLDKKESVIFDAVNLKIVEQARLPAVFAQMLETAMAAGTVVPVVGIDQGFLKVSQLDAKCCTPTFNEYNPRELERVEVKYRYVEDVWEPELREWVQVVKQYRRVIDKVSDTTYLPTVVQDENDFKLPSSPDPSLTVAHNFGFVPVVWYKHLEYLQEKSSLDGRPIHWGLCTQVEALDMALSQRHRAALYCGEPMYFETGVGDEDDPAPTGRTAVAPQPTGINPQGRPMPGGWAFGTGGGRSMPARKKGPGVVWRYENPESKVGVLTLPGDALKAIDQHANDLRSKISEALGVVFVDPAMLRGTADISGKALAVIYANQLARCNAIREDFGRSLILPVFNLIYRIILKTKDGLYLSGVQKLRPLLVRFEADVAGKKTWFSPTLDLQWGEYFDVSDVDEATRTHTAAEAYESKLITLRSFLEHVKPVFKIQNVEQYLLTLQQENEERELKEMDKAEHEANLQMKVKDSGKKETYGDGRPPAQMARAAPGDPKAGRELKARVFRPAAVTGAPGGSSAK